MFYTRINKIKVFDNREGFLGLFNKRAEMRIYSYVRELNMSPALSSPDYNTGIAISELLDLPDGAARQQRLLEAVIAGVNHLAHSSLYIDGVYFCDAFEDKDRGLTQSMPVEEIRRIKIPHQTAIPAGVYRVIVNLSPAKKRLLPLLLDVPGFSGILIHRGNTKHDSSGCILIGEKNPNDNQIRTQLSFD